MSMPRARLVAFLGGEFCAFSACLVKRATRSADLLFSSACPFWLRLPRRLSGLGQGLFPLDPPFAVLPFVLFGFRGELVDGDAPRESTVLPPLVGFLALLDGVLVLRLGVGDAVGVVGAVSSAGPGADALASALEMGEKKFRRFVLRCSCAFSSSLSESSRTFRFRRGAMARGRREGREDGEEALDRSSVAVVVCLTRKRRWR